MNADERFDRLDSKISQVLEKVHSVDKSANSILATVQAQHVALETHTEQDTANFDAMKSEATKIEERQGRIENRLYLLMGGIALLAFLLPFIAPYVLGAK